ncbi:flagellar P-ring protein precursor FlgI [Allochromatium warmingii]|uniref:Flagellar P-ring protein n=1 Tax=Allochromatium warmingii TaxID=61595 RepID=A0A1H3CNA5_ALLWA|nr:flagellar basal body P-ring protein FlgI [Allochromatium warmingii]SDX55586.1 flagellar P-ring protein precursor FlgI [Allochromatium warmingii]
MFHFSITRWALQLSCVAIIFATSTFAGNDDTTGNRFGNWNGEGQERIKDLATIGGVRDNQLIGYGLVVGLNGTGDQTTQAPFSTQSLKNMLGQLGVTMPEGVNPQTKNLAAVMITADLPPFAKPGQRLDVTVSSLGNAKSLRGGTLLMTPLKGADGQVYAMAQGNLAVGGFGVEGADGSSVTVNVPSVGRVPNGATVEREVLTNFGEGGELTLNLHRPDFTNAYRVADVINNRFGGGAAQAVDGSSVRVRAPNNPNQRVAFIAMLENLTLEAAEPPARVVVNARTGTVVMGAGVTVRPAAITHGSLTVMISEDPQVTQPNALAGGQTAITPQTQIGVEQDRNRMFLFNPGTALGDIVEAVNEVGAAPGDLVAILEALREAGALRAELVVI